MSSKVSNLVGDGSFLSFANNLIKTPVLTVPEDGLYRITAYWESPQGSNAALAIFWADDNGEQNFSPVAQWTGTIGTATFTVRAKSGSNIALATTGGRSTDITSLYYAIESLS